MIRKKTKKKKKVLALFCSERRYSNVLNMFIKIFA